jgi:phage gpG-like protein
MIDLGITCEAAKAIARLEAIPENVMSACVLALEQITQMVREDILTNRLSKPRTGGGKLYVNPMTRDDYAKWRKGKTREQIREGRPGVHREHSGPPQYPQVLSVFNSGLAQSIKTHVVEERDLVYGIVGTNLGYGAAHEFGGLGRAWLRPAWADNEERALDMWRNKISEEMLR